MRTVTTLVTHFASIVALGLTTALATGCATETSVEEPVADGEGAMSGNTSTALASSINSIALISGSGMKCAASRIGPSHLLTSQQCVAGWGTPLSAAYLPGGTFSLTTVKDPGANPPWQSFKTELTSTSGYLAVIKVAASTPLPATMATEPLDLSYLPTEAGGDTVTIAAWGTLVAQPTSCCGTLMIDGPSRLSAGNATVGTRLPICTNPVTQSCQNNVEWFATYKNGIIPANSGDLGGATYTAFTAARRLVGVWVGTGYFAVNGQAVQGFRVARVGHYSAWLRGVVPGL